jgi:hypothetical protein
MAIKRETAEWRESPRTREPFTLRYPLHDWLNGGIWELEEGVDFSEPLKQFRQALYYWTRAEYQKLRTKIERRGEQVFLIVQAYDMTPEQVAAEKERDRLKFQKYA